MSVKSKKYHVDENGRVSECKATFRVCPYDDYQTREGALTAHELKKQSNDLESRREKINALYNDPNTLRSVGRFDMSGTRGQSIRDYARNLDNDFLMNGKDPEIYYGNVVLYQDDAASKKVNLSAMRRSLPDMNEGKEKVVWTFKIEPTSLYEHKVELDINFDEDPDEAAQQAKTFIEESVRTNGVADNGSIQASTEKIYEQFNKVYSAIEEESRGPYYIWDNYGWNKGIGTFHQSNSMELIANVDYADSTLRPRLVERFLDENEDYHVGVPDITLRVYDNESGASESWWGATYDNGLWTLEMQRADDDIEYVYTRDPEEAQTLLRSFVSEHMRTNDDWTANEKSEFVADFMVQMERISAKAEAKSDEFTEILRRNRPVAEDSRTTQKRNKDRMEDKIFGNTDKNSTMGKILGIFG